MMLCCESLNKSNKVVTAMKNMEEKRKNAMKKTEKNVASAI